MDEAMSNETRINEIEEQLKRNHMARIGDQNPGLEYFQLMQEEVELKKELQQLQPEPPKEEEPGYTLWSEKEVAQLRELYPTTDSETIAKKIGRTEYALEAKARALRIRKA
jgi:hypothetical protein